METHLWAGWRRGERQPARVVDRAHVGTTLHAAIPRCSWGRDKEKGGRLPLHGKAGRLLPPGVHPALPAREEQGHTGSPDEQHDQHASGSGGTLPVLPSCLPCSTGRLPHAGPWPCSSSRPLGREQCGGWREAERGAPGGPDPPLPQRGRKSVGMLEPSLAPLPHFGLNATDLLLLPEGGGPHSLEGENGAQRPPCFLLSHIWQSSGLASPHPSSSSWRHWAAFPALHGDPPKRSTQQIEEPKCSGEGRGEGLRGG